MRRGSPLTIPNREVKPASADDTAFPWESRSPPSLGPPQNAGGLFFAINSYPSFYKGFIVSYMGITQLEELLTISILPMMKNTPTFRLLIFVMFLFLGMWVQAQERIALIQEPLVILIDPADGSVVDPSFIDLTPLSQGTPKGLIQVGEEIWITDQIEDRIDRFDLNGNYLSTISGGMDNIKGLALVNNSEIWVTNAGTNNGAPGDSMIRFDTAGTNLGFIDTEPDSSFDIIDTGTDVLISYINAGSRVERRDYSGNFIENVVAAGVVSFIQQIEVNTDNNTLYAAVFSTAGANDPGLYEFDIDSGNILNYWDVGSLRGVARLDNGNVLFSSGAGVNILDPTSGVVTPVNGTASQYFGRLDLSPCTTPPTPTGDANQSLPEGSTIEDIVVDPTTVTWFATLTDAMNNTNPLAPGTVLVDGATYYAVNIVDDCLSEPLAVTITLVLGISDFAENGIAVYPNPVTGRLTIVAEESIISVRVYDILGNLVLESKAAASTYQLDVSGLSNGVYLLQLQKGEQILTGKLIKE